VPGPGGFYRFPNKCLHVHCHLSCRPCFGHMPFCVAISRRLGYFLPWGAGLCVISFVLAVFYVCRPAAVRHGHISPFGLFPPMGCWPLCSLLCSVHFVCLPSSSGATCMAISRRLGYLLLPWGAGPCALCSLLCYFPVLCLPPSSQQRLLRHRQFSTVGSAPNIYIYRFGLFRAVWAVSPVGCRPSRLWPLFALPPLAA
jgi:hypothetical protein